MTATTPAGRAYAAAIHAARAQRDREEAVIVADYQAAIAVVVNDYERASADMRCRFQAAVTEAQRAYDLATGTRLERAS